MIGFLVDLWRSRYWSDPAEWIRRFRDLRYWRGDAKDRFQRNIRAAIQELELPPPTGQPAVFPGPRMLPEPHRPERRGYGHKGRRRTRHRGLSLKQWVKRKARHHMARESRRGNR